jgi:hypothetical protein
MPRPNRPHNFRISLPSGGTPIPPTQILLQQSDFTYLGAYDVQTNGTYSNLAQGLTHRYVSGDLRFLNWQYGGRLDEFSLAGKSYGQTITTPTQTWASIGATSVGAETLDAKALWWDEAGQRLWTTGCVLYTANLIPTQIYTRTLNSNGTISNLHGPVSLQNVTAKRVYGGAQAVPTWFQTAYGVGPYAVGWGGGTSLILQGGNASIGPTLYTLPDPAGYANGAVIPTTPISKTLMDFAPANLYRGVRVTLPINYLDGGMNAPNPSTPPNYPPVAGAQWQSPRPDGKGWWTPCDSYWNCGCWIDTPTRKGFINILTAWSGKVYYMSSDVNCDFMKFELHIFDPADLGRAAQGSVSPHSIEPASMAELTLPGLSDQGPRGSLTPGMSAGGATYDPISQRLYILGLGINRFTTTNRLYVYQVAA